eukprot:TRINITY_DN2329_c0_g1_i5.p3 TRINITY_DN2329_c0_g1~~TRINITY_DN2329_c0_g1_i5.p3  ORF type:complete len:168 (+),score=25.58 TRINITY_DN2329_c0_g1_i5:75-578(+)
MGALLGIGFLSGTIPNALDSSFGANAISPAASAGNAFMGEMMMSMFLMHVILGTTTDTQNKGGIAGPLVIGLTVFLAHGVLLPLDGCSLNPARSFGPAAMSGQWADFGIFLFAPVIGACLAVPIHHYLMKSGANDNGEQHGQFRRLQQDEGDQIDKSSNVQHPNIAA